MLHIIDLEYEVLIDLLEAYHAGCKDYGFV